MALRHTPGCRLTWANGVALVAAAAVSAGLSGCASKPPAKATVADDRPMVAPEPPPPPADFNVKVAKPLPTPVAPSFEALPVPAAPPPPVVIQPLVAPELAALPALPPALTPPDPAQRAQPIARPAESPRDSVSALEGASTGSSDAARATPRPTVALEANYRLEFAANSSELPETAPPLLEHLAAQMAVDDRIRLRLRSYASGTNDDPVTARRLSLQRALKTREVLIARGIPSTRVDILALGIDATDTTGAPPNRIDIIPVN